MLVHKAYKFRIYPNKTQETLIHKTLGCCRFVYNFTLSEKKKQDEYWQITQQMVNSGQLPENNWKSSFFSKPHNIQNSRVTSTYQSPWDQGRTIINLKVK